MAKRKLETDDDNDDVNVAAFSGFTLPKALKKKKVEKAEAFRRAAQEDQHDDLGLSAPSELSIPMIKDNKWYHGHKAQKRSKNSEKDNSSVENDKPITNSSETVEKSQNSQETENEIVSRHIPLIMQNRIPGMEEMVGEDEKFRHDMSMRPDAVDFDSDVYDRVPIDSFGTALLRGMGWTKGSKIGLTNAAVTKPVEFIPRGFHQGLGAEVKVVEPPKVRKDGKRWINKPGQSKPKEKMRLKPTANGHTRHHRAPDEELVPVKNTQPRKNALVEIKSGKHRTLFGRIVDLSDEECSIRLNISESQISISLRSVEVLDEHALPAGHPAFATRSVASSERVRDKKIKKDHLHRLQWVIPDIRIRILSKELGRGRFYCKKGRVEDVSSPYQFMVVMDTGETLNDVRECDVETVAPKIGKKVILVNGRDKGNRGTLLEKSSKRNAAVVQLSGDLNVIKCTLDDICEYLAHHDEDF
uniref:G-patch domain-containing protein n=1 Tax=Hirondellea gigas TaxID=1518452 RepID=A0A6A7FXJ3_9CRUS